MSEFKSMGDYQYSEKKNSVTALTFLLVGVGIGAIAALLMAPKSGKQMRKAVRRRFEDARDTAEEYRGKASDYWDRGSEWASDTKQRVRPFMKMMRRD